MEYDAENTNCCNHNYATNGRNEPQHQMGIIRGGIMIRKSRTCVLNMPMNEGQGDPHDSSGFGNNPSAAAFSWVNGSYGRAVDFNGTNQYVRIDDADILDLNDTFTVMWWMKAPDQLGYPRAIQKGTNYYVYKETGLNRLRCRIYDGSIAETVHLDGVFDDTWHHCAYTFDRNANMVGYVDGVAGIPNPIDPALLDITSSDYVWIAAAGITAHNLDGHISDVLIHNIVYTEAKMAAYVNGMKARFGR